MIYNVLGLIFFLCNIFMTIVFAPQKGPQTEFLKTNADIAIYGGAAGGGKTYALMLDAVRTISIGPNIEGVLFRKTVTDLKKPGGIIDESSKIYPYAGGKLNRLDLKWRFNNNSKITMAGLQYEKDKSSWQGSQLDFVAFDELTHFDESQFWYLFGRLRSTSGLVCPYLRATTNPEPGSWIYHLIKWWINKDGSPNLEKSGKLRWFYRSNDNFFWFNSKIQAINDLKNKNIYDSKPISLTFIPANINDNQELIKKNPNYYSMLSQLPLQERMKLLEGNWLWRPCGKLFKAEWFNHYYCTPQAIQGSIIVCDTAHDTKRANDYTVFQYWVYKHGRIYLEKQLRGKWDYNTQLQLLKALILETNATYVSIEKAATGHSLLQDVPRQLSVCLLPMIRTKDKYTRGYEIQSYIQCGYVYINPNSDYFTNFIAEVTQFSPDDKDKKYLHDDQVDCLIDAIYHLLVKKICHPRKETVKDVHVQRCQYSGLRPKSVIR